MLKSRPVRALLSAALLLGLAGCTPHSGAAEPVSPACTGPDLSTLQADAHPTGPATACLSQQSISVIDEHSAPQLPVTLTDDTGTQVTVTDISRVLALDISGTLAATVFALGMGDHLVGRDQASSFAEAAQLPMVTPGGPTITAEPILALAPTLIITDGSLGPNSVLRQLRDSGVAVVFVESDRSLNTVATITEQVATALGVPSRGTALAAQLSSQITQVSQQVAAFAGESSPRVLFLYLRGSASIYYLFGEGSGADTLITALGARDVASEMGWTGMKPVTAEALVAAAPDAVLVMTDGLASVGGIDGLLQQLPALAQTPAGQQRRIIDMADAEVLSFGPRSAGVLSALAQALYAPSSLASSSTAAHS
ncbi:MAG: heme/hemin ABC transporter substrate-binding protein [Microbacteriaceae bacterium]